MNSELLSPALSRASRIIDDVDALPTVLVDGIEGEFVQLDAAPFSVRWRVASRSDAVVQFTDQDSAVIRRLRIPADRWAFTIPLRRPVGARWNGRAVAADDILINPPGTGCFAFDPGGTHLAIVSVPLSSRLARFAGAVTPQEGDGASFTTCSHQAGLLRDTLERLYRAIDSRDPASVRIVDEACAAAGDALAACLEARGRRRGASSPASRSHIVSRAEQCFRSHVGEGLSIARLSRLAGVSERSLRNAFHDVYTTSPKRYLKLWQLHQVHHALRSAHAARRGTVTDVATCHGFYELGRFAGEYKSLFGEPPSATLNRARRASSTNDSPARGGQRPRGGPEGPLPLRRRDGAREPRAHRSRLHG